MGISCQELIMDLDKRGLIAQHSGTRESFIDHFSIPNKVVYCGFDPTADSLHVGHLVPLLMLKRFQLAGHTPLALIGGATGMIGDPSFKATERTLNTQALVNQWVDKISGQIETILSSHGSRKDVHIVNNADWVKAIDILTFLRIVGKNFSINSMVAKESVKQRLNRPDHGISLTEFSYSLLQSYDFSELNKQHGCSLQIGGNDQWGNITAGIELTRKLNGSHVYGMTLPLITKADGTKFGKTESGAIWLDPAKTAPEKFFKFWLSSNEKDVYNYLRYYTFLSNEEIKAIEEKDRTSTESHAQLLLAREVTRLVHGDKICVQAESEVVNSVMPPAL